jgi:hypothetical protein
MQEAGPSESDTTESNSAKTLYAPLDASELATRHEAINQSKDFLTVLRSSAENPDNAKILTQAADELERLETLLPANLDARKPHTQEPAPEAENSAPPQAKLNAEVVADQLQTVRRLTRAAVLSEWAVDRAFDDAAKETDQEQKHCVEAERALKKLRLNMGCSIVVLLIASVSTAFLTLVLADLTQALLDSATSSAFIASAYQNPGQGSP